jgi:hypothetical protein
MSRATEIIVIVSTADVRHVEQLSFWLADQAPRSDDRVDTPAGQGAGDREEMTGEHWGGALPPATPIWAGVANHLDLPAFVDRVARVLWDDPDHVQLLARDDGDPWFRLYMIREGHAHQYAPAPPTGDQDRPW